MKLSLIIIARSNTIKKCELDRKVRGGGKWKTFQYKERGERKSNVIHQAGSVRVALNCFISKDKHEDKSWGGGRGGGWERGL